MTTHAPVPSVSASPLVRNADVSVVLPYFRSELFVREAINSIVDQDCPIREIVVVDDGTPYESAEQALSPYPFVTVVRQENQGPGAARQAGFLLTTTPYVCFLDCDDRIAAGGLTRLRTALESHPDWGMVSGRAMVIDEHGAPTGELMLPQPLSKDLYSELLERTYICPPGSVLFRRSALEKVGGWHSAWNRWGVEDYDVYLRLARRGPIGCLQDIVTEYRRHPGSQGQDSERLLDSIVHVLEDEREYTELDWQREQSRLAGLAYWRREFDLHHRERELHTAWTSGEHIRAVRLAAGYAFRFPRAAATSIYHRGKARLARRHVKAPERSPALR